VISPPLTRFLLAALALLSVLWAAARAQDSVLVFNELHYHPANEATQTEWVELRSLQAVDVDIGAWRIEGGIDYTFPNGTVMPGLGYIVVAKTPGQMPGALGPFTGQLDNGGETLRLVNRNGRVMDELTYGDNGAWPVGPDGGGVTLARRTASAASGPAQWAASGQLGGTPGEQNFSTNQLIDRTLVAPRAAWKYRDADAAPPVDWASAAFQDAAWTQGSAVFGTPPAGGPVLTVTANLVERFRASAISGVADGGVVTTWADGATGDGVAQNAAAGSTSPTLRLNVTPSGKPVVRFTGTDELRTTVSPGIAATSGFAYFAVVKANGLPVSGGLGDGAGAYVFDRHVTGSGAPLVSLKAVNGSYGLQKRYDANTGLGGPVSATPISTTSFQIVAVRRNRTLGRFELWVNGVLEATEADTGAALTPDPINLGRHTSTATAGWNGDIAEVLVYANELTDANFLAVGSYLKAEYGLDTAFPGFLIATPLAASAPTSYFRKTFNFPGLAANTTLRLTHTVADGAVFYLNGSEIFRTNLPAGSVTHTTPASSIVTNPGTSTPIAVPAGALVQGANVLAVSLHKAASSPGVLFDASLDSTETPVDPAAGGLVFNEMSGAGDANFFLELRNTSSSAINTDGWMIKTSAGAAFALPAQVVPAGGLVSFTAAVLGLAPADGLRLFLFAPGGATLMDAREITNRLRGLTADGHWGRPTTATPGGVNVVTVSTAIVINEIFYHGLGTSPEQWIELHNRSAAPVDVSRWQFTEGITYEFPPGTPAIPPGGFAVVAWDPAAFAALHPGVSAYGPWSGSLSRKGETITLCDANENVADEVTYAEGGRWSHWADGGGSSLELRDPFADNSQGEAWAASDESANAAWTTVTSGTYQGLAANSNGADPTNYNEFVFGLLDEGEFLIDDISVRNVTTGNVELIQNGTFESGTAAGWRILGNHTGTVINDGAGKVLKVSASGPTEHMHNHAETTLKNGSAYVLIDPAHTYNITFRAKWLRGSNRLHTRLWHNRLPRQTLLPVPTTGGTPGAVNGQRVPNIGPTFAALAHTPVVPAAGQAATVSIQAADPQGVASVQLFTSLNGAAFTSSSMTSAGGGVFTATVPAQAAGALVQFYVQATDGLGAVATFPAAGAGARAMIPWADGRAQLTLPSGAKPHNLRVVLPTADATELYRPENLMSDAARPCTVILNESEAYYRAAVRLRSSEHGRIVENRCGYTLEFAADELFLGRHDTIGIDRSGGTATGQREILLKRLENTAGGIIASEDDLCRVISAVGTLPASQYFSGAGLTGAAILSKTRLDKEFLDAQWPGGGDGSQHKYERVYVLTQTIDPVTRVISTPTFGAGGTVLSALAENPKVPQSTTSPPGVAVTSLGANKEAYRWYWLLQNARTADDYMGIMNVTNAIGQAGGSASFNTLVAQHVDVDMWLRAIVPANLYGVIDNYLGNGTGQHNALIHFPPGRKAVLIPWDLDFLSQTNPTTTSLTTGGDVAKFLANPVWKRRYWGHMLDVLNRSFNSSYMTAWATHYSRFGTDDMVASVSSYLAPRAAYALNVIYGTGGQTAPIPFVAFARTSASPVTVSTPFTTVSGVGWINIAEIRVAGSALPLAVTWTGETTWSLSLPVSAGTNTYTLHAYDPAGVQVGTTSVVVTGTGGIFPAGPGNLAISELHYNPPGSGDETEFLELLNLTNATLDLGGCHFDEESGQGIAYTFPTGVQLAAGARLVVARNRAAFQAAYPGVANLAPNQYDPSALDNSGEMLVLYAASGQEIFRFSYDDSIASTDGGGRSLVRVLSSTSPDGSTYLWRASTVPGGNPGTSDALALAGSASADADSDGLRALLEYALGTSDTEPGSAPVAWMRDALGRHLFTFPRVINADDAVLSLECAAPFGSAWVPATATLFSTSTAGNIATETWQITPPPDAATFAVRLKATRR
jgi:hypothetical protein